MANKKLSPVNKNGDNTVARMEEQEMREDVEYRIENGIHLVDSGEDTVHEMLCGYTDKDGVKHTTYTLRDMTGRDEEAVSKPDVRQNPAKALNVLLSRCVTSIGTLYRKDFKNPRDWGRCG